MNPHQANPHALDAERIRSLLTNLALTPRQRRELMNRLRHHEAELHRQQQKEGKPDAK
jgi:hypothetical protein